jgi:hypothetical protein
MRFVIMLLAIVATPSLVHAQAADFEVTGGASLNGFTYTQQGALQYRGRAFSPAVTANPRDVARFRIPRSPSSPLAAAIASTPMARIDCTSWIPRCSCRGGKSSAPHNIRC